MRKLSAYFLKSRIESNNYLFIELEHSETEDLNISEQCGTFIVYYEDIDTEIVVDWSRKTLTGIGTSFQGQDEQIVLDDDISIDEIQIQESESRAKIHMIPAFDPELSNLISDIIYKKY